MFRLVISSISRRPSVTQRAASAAVSPSSYASSTAALNTDIPSTSVSSDSETKSRIATYNEASESLSYEQTHARCEPAEGTRCSFVEQSNPWTTTKK